MEEEIILSGMLVAGFGFKRFLHCSKGKKRKDEACMQLFDGHTHSGNSYDGEHDVIFIAEKAEAKGLLGFAVTDHCDVERYQEDHLAQVIRQSIFDAKLAASIFKDRVKILAGMELGQPLSCIADAENALCLGNFDYVIGSLHGLNGQQDFYFVDFEKHRKEVPSILKAYFHQLLELVQWGKFNTLAHITYPMRYIVGVYHIPVDISFYQQQIDEIFRLLIEKEIALELNTSGLRQPLGEMLPSQELLQRYYQLGGRLLTIGSDSHNAFDIGKGVSEGALMAKKIGFPAYYYYEKKMPVEISL